MRYALALTAVVVIGTGLDAHAAPPSLPQLIAAYQRADEGCRGNPSDAADAECDRRTRLNSRLNQIGWCYGMAGQSRAAFEWHRCTAASFNTTDLEPSAR